MFELCHGTFKYYFIYHHHLILWQPRHSGRKKLPPSSRWKTLKLRELKWHIWPHSYWFEPKLELTCLYWSSALSTDNMRSKEVLSLWDRVIENSGHWEGFWRIVNILINGRMCEGHLVVLKGRLVWARYTCEYTGDLCQIQMDFCLKTRISSWIREI